METGYVSTTGKLFPTKYMTFFLGGGGGGRDTETEKELTTKLFTCNNTEDNAIP
jgi:hypothetical protein